MSKLLVNAPTGAQEIIEVGEGGGYFDEYRVLWDKREDGEMPEITLGAMVRVGDSLVVDQALLVQSIAANLDRDRTAKWAAIKATRDQRKNGGVLVSGKWFHSDADSRIQQLGLVLMGASVPAVMWKTMDGSFVPMSQTLATQIFQAVAALDMNLFSVAEAHRAAMNASANPAQYDFSENWPEQFK